MDLTQEQAFTKEIKSTKICIITHIEDLVYFFISFSRYELSVKENVQKITKEQHYKFSVAKQL